MIIKTIEISACVNCMYLSSNAYQNSWYCRNPATSGKSILAPTIIPEWCELPDAKGAE